MFVFYKLWKPLLVRLLGGKFEIGNLICCQAHTHHTVSCESGFWTIEKWKVKKECHSLFSRSASEKKWLEFEIEKWKWNKSDWKSRSRGEISREFSKIKKSFLTYFVLGCAPSSNGNIFLWNLVSNFTLLSREKGWNYFPFTFFEKWKWNSNDWKSRSRSESEIKMTRDREVKFEIFLENSRESRLSQVTGWQVSKC